MNIQDYKDMVEKDFVIVTEQNVLEETGKAIYLAGKWAGFLMDERLKLLNIQQIKETKYLEKYNYYAGVGPNPYPVKLLKNEIERYITADTEYQAVMIRFRVQQELVNYLQNINGTFQYSRHSVLKIKTDLLKHFEGI